MQIAKRFLVTTLSTLLTIGVAHAAWYQPTLATTAEIQLQGKPNLSYPANLYVLDLFDTPTATIAGLKASGKQVVCYFSAGSYEDWRPDAKKFVATDLGNKLDGWNERWLDIRSANVRKIMQARLNRAVAKGCEGVDPDNVDGYTNNPGFPLTASDQLNYNRFIANQAHARGLAVGLKNDLNQIPALVRNFDFSTNEQCHQYNECNLLAPFIKAGKPVFNIEYKQTYINDAAAQQKLCADAAKRKFNTLILPHSLNGSFRISCN
jgi:hypothetical protein